MNPAAQSLRRARPLLGTLVDIRVDGLAPADAAAAVSAAFAEVAEIDRRMSFHSQFSDLARLHRAPPGCRVRVDPRTHAVLAAARDLAQASSGLFDPTIAPVLVARGALPAPRAEAADPAARWHDLEILDDDCVRRRSALWIDLGGIAKGYAVDRALAVLERHGAAAACVNAGGDLARFGAGTEIVELRLAEAPDAAVPAIALGIGAVATSANRVGHRAQTHGTHLDGRTRRSAPKRRAASVLAASCMIADALTKIVLASPRAARALLAAHGASACLYEPARGWCMLGGQ